MTREDHKKLATLLHSVKAKVAISGYVSPLTKELYGDWTRIDAPVKIATSAKAPRRESLWINYKIEEIGEENIQKLKEMGCKFHLGRES